MNLKKKTYTIILTILCIFLLTGCKEEKKEDKTIKCEKGSYLIENECKKASEVVNALESYSCEENYTLNDDYSKCIKTETKDAKIDNPCPSDYEYSNFKCNKTETKDIIVTPSCINENGVLNADRKTCTHTEIRQPKYTTTCPSGYYIYGFDCHKKNRSGIKCYTGEIFSAEAGGCLDIFDYVKPTSQYICGTGYTLEGNNCVRRDIINALQNKSCPSGFTESNGKCKKTITIDVSGKYYCEEGFTLNDHTCTKVTKKDSIKKYSCENDEFTLIEKSCVKFETKETTNTKE